MKRILLCLIFSVIVLTSFTSISASEIDNNSFETNIDENVIESNSLNEIPIGEYNIDCEKNSSLISSDGDCLSIDYSDENKLDLKESQVNNMSNNSTFDLVNDNDGVDTNKIEFNKNLTVKYDVLSNVDMSKDTVNFYLKNSNDMKNLFKFIGKNFPSWNFINITLAPNTVFKIDFSTYDTKLHDYALRLSGKMQINGKEGSVIMGNDKKHLMYICPSAQLVLVNVSIQKFTQVFINYGTIFSSNCLFKNNKAILKVYGDKNERQKYQEYTKSFMWDGGVIYNAGYAYFNNCTFQENIAKRDTGDKICGGVLLAEQNAVTVFDSCTFKDCRDSFIVAKEQSLTIL